MIFTAYILKISDGYFPLCHRMPFLFASRKKAKQIAFKADKIVKVRVRITKMR